MSGPSWSSIALLAGYWLCDPLCIFAFSWLTGDSVFVPRYLAFALPGIARAATAITARFVPSAALRPFTLVFAAGVLVVMGHWTEVLTRPGPCIIILIGSERRRQ